MSEMRLQKWLSQLGIASRREAEKWISEGRVAINGRVVSELGTRVNPEVDNIAVDGRAVKSKLPPKVYWLLNKPDKHLTARSDELTDKKTIYDIPMIARAKFLVNPVGRLDFRTEGLLLLTNDGELSYKLCRPEYHVPREYQALLDSRLTREEEQEIKKGITLEDGPVTDVKIKFVHGENLGVSTGSWYIVTVHEGRNRLVRRMFEHFGKRVVRLIRVGFGDIRLPVNLPAGEYRQLTAEEVASLRAATERPIDTNLPARKKVSRSKGRSLRKPLSQKPDKPAAKDLKSHARKPKEKVKEKEMAETTTAKPNLKSKPAAKTSPVRNTSAKNKNQKLGGVKSKGNAKNAKPTKPKKS
jgi:pseudouridine synthase